MSTLEKKNLADTSKTFRALITGDYWANGPAGKEKKAYAIELVIPYSWKEFGYLHCIRKNILSEWLKKKFPDFASVRTCQISGSRPTTDTDPPITDPKIMGRPKILEYVASKKYTDFVPDLFPTLGELREQLIAYETDRDSFLKFQNRRYELQAPYRAQDILSTFYSLNGESP